MSSVEETRKLDEGSIRKRKQRQKKKLAPVLKQRVSGKPWI